MDDDKVLELTGKIEETLGKDNFATIADTIGEILTGNTLNMKALSDKDAEIDRLKDRNDKLVASNGALLQKIPMGYESKENQKKEEAQPSYSLKDAFDAKGNFRK